MKNALCIGPRTTNLHLVPTAGLSQTCAIRRLLARKNRGNPWETPWGNPGGNPGRCQEKADQKRSDGRAAGGNGSASAEGRSGEVGHAGIFTPPLIIIVFINFGFSIVISTRCRAQRGCGIDAKYGFEPYSSPASRLGWLINMHVVRALSCQ